MRKVIFLSSKEKKNSRKKNIFFLAWIIVYWLLKSHSFEFFLGGGKYGLFWAKKLMEIWYLLITKKFLFWTFREWEIRSFFEKKVSEKMTSLITEMLLYWIFWEWKIRYFFESKSWWKDDTYWLLKSSCFELFGDVKVIFTWSFGAFHDILGLGKYGFSCSVSILMAC